MINKIFFFSVIDKVTKTCVGNARIFLLLSANEIGSKYLHSRTSVIKTKYWLYGF